ncbi:hypothetical protein [Halobacteriovorax sp.]|uniref:hypothetical protein n=1 Tax=Halobacteriovorax sp. TaxID=2020862 RepID=UPI00356534AC
MTLIKILLPFFILANILASDVEVVARANSYGSFNLPDSSFVLNSTVRNNSKGSIAFSFSSVIEEQMKMGMWVRNDHYPAGGVIHISKAGDYISDPFINEKGDIVFTVFNELEVVAVYLYKNKKNNLEKVLDTKDTSIFLSIKNPEVNNSGTILFRASFRTGEKAIIIYKDNEFKTIATDKDPKIAYLFGASFIDGNNIALKVREGSSLAESQPDTIRLYDKRGHFTRLNSDHDFDENSIFSHFNNTIGSHFSSKYFAFIAKLRNGKSVLVRQYDDSFQIIATEGEGGISKLEYFAPSVNERGSIAFRAINASKKRAIFFFDGFIFKEVLTEGDLISTDQSTAVIHSSNGPAFGGGLTINNNDEIALQAKVSTKYKEEPLGTAVLSVSP